MVLFNTIKKIANINCRRLLEEFMEVTITNIARIAEVSYSTVSKALNNSPLVKESTKRTVLDIANQMGYHPNMVAKSLVSKKSNTI